MKATAEELNRKFIGAELARVPPPRSSSYRRDLGSVLLEVNLSREDVLGVIGIDSPTEIGNGWTATYESRDGRVQFKREAVVPAKSVTPTIPVTTGKSTPAATIRPVTAAPVRTSPTPPPVPTPVPSTPAVSTKASTSDQDATARRRAEEQQRQFRSHGIRWQNR